IHDQVLAVFDIALKYVARQGRFNLTLNRALERTCAVIGVVANADDMLAGRFSERKGNMPFGKASPEPLELNLDDLLEIFFIEAMKDNDLVHTVQELGPEVPPHLFSDGFLHPLVGLRFK